MKGIIFLLFIISMGIQACPEVINSKSLICNKKYTRSLLENQLADLLDMNYFSELRGIDISLKDFKSDAYYLATGIKGLLKKSEKRKYIIKINEKLYDCAPTDRAMKAILAHELIHIKDYVNGSRLNMIGFGLKYALQGAKVERGTDYRVFELGMAVGIKEYRQWIYQLLSPKDLKKKRKRYYTPEEIDSLIKVNKGFSYL